jgi:hypothetical protein
METSNNPPGGSRARMALQMVQFEAGFLLFGLLHHPGLEASRAVPTEGHSCLKQLGLRSLVQKRDLGRTDQHLL